MKTGELPIQVREICDSFIEGLGEILDVNLLGIYMYGATVFPDCGQVQDIDCHVILETPPTDNEREEIRRLYETLSLRFPPRGGELLDAYFI